MATQMKWAGRLKHHIMRLVHFLDYRIFLPFIARLPLSIAYRLSAIRGWTNGVLKRDYRSTKLFTGHMATKSPIAYKLLVPQICDADLKRTVAQRFETECREEFEGRLIAARRVSELKCDFTSQKFLEDALNSEKGLILLTPHFDSFTLGIVFLGQMGIKINAMASLPEGCEAINPPAYQHFISKYKFMETYMNGGKIVPIERGWKPFYEMLKRKECIMILGDVPLYDDKATAATPLFLGGRRRIAGGPLRMAKQTNSNFASFVCRNEGIGRYTLDGSPILDAKDPEALDSAYALMSRHIMAAPGRWWTPDILPDMPIVESEP